MFEGILKRKILLLFLSWRILLCIPLYIAYISIPYRVGYAYTSPLYFIGNHKNFISFFLLSPWANFDGVYYLLIAAYGYTSNAGFFPLYPVTVYFLSSLLGYSKAFDPIQFFSAFFLSNVYFLLALFVFYKLIILDYKKNVGIKTIIFLLIFPASFFYASIYSESLFLLLTVLCFYFARKKKWFLAGFIGALLTATRLVGIAILPALAWEIYSQGGKKGGLLKYFPILISLSGVVSYMFFNILRWKNPFYFIIAQGKFQNNRSVETFILFPQTVYRYIKIILTVIPNHFEWWISLFELLTFFFIVFLFYLAWKKRIRFSYLLFAFGCFIIPVSSGTFSGLPRYSLVLFPLFMALGMVKRKIIVIFYAVISLILLFLSLIYFSRGYFVS